MIQLLSNYKTQFLTTHIMLLFIKDCSNKETNLYNGVEWQGIKNRMFVSFGAFKAISLIGSITSNVPL